MEQVEQGVEKLIPHAHEEEEWPGCVVEAKQGILLLTNVLVGSLAQHVGSVEVDPVARNVHHHHQLEEEQVGRVEDS